MKKSLRHILMVPAFFVLIGLIGIKTYRTETQFDLNSGMERTGIRSFGITFQLSDPKPTPLSVIPAKPRSNQPWLTVEERGIPNPWEPRIDYSYPRLLFQFRANARILNNDKLVEVLAELTLDELVKLGSTNKTTRHLQKIWDVLLESYSGEEPITESELHEFWQRTRQ